SAGAARPCSSLPTEPPRALPGQGRPQSYEPGSNLAGAARLRRPPAEVTASCQQDKQSQRPSSNRKGEAPAEPCAAESPGSAGASPSQLTPCETASQPKDSSLESTAGSAGLMR